MTKKILVIALAMIVSSCSAMGILKGAAKAVSGASDSGINSDVQIAGERTNNTEVTAKKESHTNTISNVQAKDFSVKEDHAASKVEGNQNKVTINNNNPWTIIWLVLAGVVGWLLPTPSALWAQIKGWYQSYKDRRVAKAAPQTQPTDNSTQPEKVG